MQSTTYHIASNGNYWQLSWRDSAGKRRRKSLGSKQNMSRRDAEAAMQRIIADHAQVPQMRDVPQSGQLGAWCERYLSIRADEIDVATIKIHRRANDLLLAYFPGHVRIDAITKSQATDWRINIKRQNQFVETTVCKYVRAAKRILNRAVDEDWSAIHNFHHLKGTAPRKQMFDRRAIDRSQVESVLAAAGDEATALIMVGYFTGLRTSEILHLRWEHCDLARNVITVVPRGGVETSKQRLREVRVEPELLVWLAAREQEHGTVLGMIERGAKNMAARRVKEACVAAGVEPFTIQNLRQTRDTIWHGQYPAHVACAWLGHSEQIARQNYLSIDPAFYCHNDAPSGGIPSAPGGEDRQPQWALLASDLVIETIKTQPRGGDQ